MRPPLRISHVVVNLCDHKSSSLCCTHSNKAFITKVKNVGMPYVTERWPGGMLTNFVTIRKAIRKMATIDKMAVDEITVGEMILK